MTYAIAINDSATQLEDEVNAMIEDGFEPHGNLCVVQYQDSDGLFDWRYCQPKIENEAGGKLFASILFGLFGMTASQGVGVRPVTKKRQ